MQLLRHGKAGEKRPLLPVWHIASQDIAYYLAEYVVPENWLRSSRCGMAK
jgi:hypothetical protein